ncbi:nuclear transport factor 2 family protein [Novosphingobium sp. FSY-8]|uniref:Nuclear transport factor 2 family protein n=1 Tax=Novosphingobium ovatum TaxID=1908523 RepID=A0ABW9XCJ9_9SPHN|nr:nuclear transport factor 2 family protein [Novosphingobium ovatum]NBC36197.1 nuclear transport factor 2 family protein [Novosphingobium ovatum]
MDRAAYDAYVAAFNARDYDTVCDFYAEPINMNFFGVALRSRADMKAFYGFLHAHAMETVRVLNFASSSSLTAVDAIVRVEATRDMTPEALAQQGLTQFHPMRAGDVIEMRQFIFYTIRDGRIANVECAMAPA